MNFDMILKHSFRNRGQGNIPVGGEKLTTTTLTKITDYIEIMMLKNKKNSRRKQTLSHTTAVTPTMPPPMP